MQNGDVAVVILNWNGVQYLKQFLPNVIKYSQPYRIVLADNASTDCSVAYVRENFPDVEIIINLENGGFAKGYNDALKKISAEFYVLLNSDIEVSPNWLTPLLQMVQDKKVAGCQPKIKSFSNPKYFEHAGAAGGFLDIDYFPFCRGRIFETIEEDNGQYNNNQEIFWATGACLLIRAELYHLVGGLDEDFFAHMEEIDLCWRLKRLGYSFYSVGNAEVFHVGGGTLNYRSPRKTYLNFRNSLYMIAKNHEGKLFLKIFRRLCIDGLAGIRFLISGNFSHLSALIKAHFNFYANLKIILKKRKQFNQQFPQMSLNEKGIYKKSIVWKHYATKTRYFSAFSENDFK
jgi:GT2 family glycosyltransferase